MKPSLDLADARIFMSNLKNDRGMLRLSTLKNIYTYGGNDRNFIFDHL